MAGPGRTDLLGRLADLSEEALQRLGDMPGAERAASAMNTLRDRIDELQKRVRGLEGLEQRIATLERKVEKLSKSSSAAPATTRRSTKTTGTKSAS
jgi:prefoldin subunit 5